MRYLKLVFSLAAVAALAGCTDHNKDYLYQSGSVDPVVSVPGAKVKKGQNYYPVPNVSSGGVQSAPSLVPPGSDFQRFKKKAQRTPPKAHQKVATRLEKNPKGLPVLALSETQKQAWTDVGKALQKTAYKVLDQDPSMASYYILDSDTTGQRITKKTPIYRVYLKGDGAKTNVFLLDKENQPASALVAHRVLNALRTKIA